MDWVINFFSPIKKYTSELTIKIPVLFICRNQKCRTSYYTIQQAFECSYKCTECCERIYTL